MGFFSSLWKGVKKVFKKIGKGIKSAVQGIGKFVGKLGIVGQIGMMFFMPHIGGFLMKGLSGAAKALLGVTGKGLGGTLARGLGTVLNGAHKFATTAGNVFSTVTEGVSQFAKTALNKIPGVSIEGAATDFFGNDSAWSRTLDKAGTVFDPFKGQATSFGDKTLAEFSNSTGISQENLMTLNPELQGLKPDSIVPKDIYSTDVSLIRGIEANVGRLPTPSLDPTSAYQQQMRQDLGYLSETPLSEQQPIPSMEVKGPYEPYEESYILTEDGQGVVPGSMQYEKPQIPAAVSEPSLLSTAATSLRKSFETDPLRTTERLLNVAGQAQQLGYEEPDVFYGAGPQLGSLYEPSVGYQPEQAPILDPSQGLYGYSAFAGGNSYDWSQTSPYLYYMQQQQRYAA